MLKAKREASYAKDFAARYVFDAQDLQDLVPEEVLQQPRSALVFEWLQEWFRDTAGRYCPGRMFAGHFDFGFTIYSSYGQAWCNCERPQGYLREDLQAACRCVAPEALEFRTMNAQERQEREEERKRALASWLELTGGE